MDVIIMPQVYTKEESDRLWKEIKDLIASKEAQDSVTLVGIREELQAKFNELFSLYHEVRNHAIMIEDEFKKLSPERRVRSPYVTNRPTH